MLHSDRWRPLHSHGYTRARTTGVLVLAILMTANAHPVRAEVRVEGDARSVRVEASQASVADVLTALGPSFNVRFRTVIPLQEVVNATFTGALEQVIPKMLDGYSYVLKKEQNSVEVLIVGARGARAVFVEPPKAPVQESLAKQWRSAISTTGAQKP